MYISPSVHSLLSSFLYYIWRFFSYFTGCTSSVGMVWTPITKPRWFPTPKYSPSSRSYQISSTTTWVLDWFNSLIPGRSGCDSKKCNFQSYFTEWHLQFVWKCLQMNTVGPYNDRKSTLVQVMAWCRQATSYYLNRVGQDHWCHMASLGEWVKKINSFKFCITHW